VQRNSVTVRVPASTSNLGSGFDTLGLALRLYNDVRVSRNPAPGVQIATPMRAGGPAAARPLAIEAADLFFRRTGQRAFGITVALDSEVPSGRGLGASATLRLGVVAALNELLNARLERRQLLEFVTQLEGHPDNASPAIFGGFTVSGRTGDTVRCLSFPVSPRLKAVTLIPRFELPTFQARGLLPATYSRVTTAHALNRSAFIAAALSSRNYEALRGFFDDRMHQPYRAKLLPHLEQVIRAGERAGALGGFLSGAGSAIICLTLQSPEAVGVSMRRQWPDSEVKILTPDNRGFTVLDRLARR
jgi:homoserine kinase